MKQQFRLGDVTKIKPSAYGSSHGLETGIHVKVTSVKEVAMLVLDMTRAQVDELPVTDGIGYGVKVIFEDESNPIHKHERFVTNDELEAML